MGDSEKNEDTNRVEQRVKLLQEALNTSHFEPERENIRAAIEGYKSGEITYESDCYTLIYAGKIVDRAPDYASMVANRQERLDAYAAEHGEHWLWYESPLRIKANSLPVMARTSQLIRDNNYDCMGVFWINLGFWKRAHWVARLPGMALPYTTDVPNATNFLRLPNGLVYCQNEGPKLAYKCMLE